MKRVLLISLFAVFTLAVGASFASNFNGVAAATSSVSGQTVTPASEPGTEP